VIVLQSSMPVAVFNYLFAENYDRNPRETAELVVISTLFSLVTIPLILLFLN
ncbi:AEC family transporter, partial [Candidatus Peregrinibacteria bacterium]|nr:AEC family transporter [Candidatus Peregrinibacteria bacterium]